MNECITSITVSPANSGTVSRTAGETTTTRVRTDYTWTYYWDTSILQPTPNKGYKFDHWEITTTRNEYSYSTTPGGRGSLTYTSTTTTNPTTNPLQFGPNYTVDVTPHYVDVEPTGTTKHYWYPESEWLVTIVAVFTKSHEFTHIPMYSAANNLILRGVKTSLVIRDD